MSLFQHSAIKIKAFKVFNMFLTGFLIWVFAFFGYACANDSKRLNVGDKAPDFSLPTDDGQMVSLQDYRGSKSIVLFFYPKAGTPGCTKEACAFRDTKSLFENADIEIIGISTDSREDLKNFRTEFNLNFTLVSDHDKKISKKYGALSAIGFAKRTTFIINKEGIVHEIFEDVDPVGHAEEILKSLSANPLQ